MKVKKKGRSRKEGEERGERDGARKKGQEEGKIKDILILSYL